MVKHICLTTQYQKRKKILSGLPVIDVNCGFTTNALECRENLKETITADVQLCKLNNHKY